MKGKFALQILEQLTKTAKSTGDVFDAFLQNEYGAGADKVISTAARMARLRAKNDEKRRTHLILQRRYHNILSWLRRDGLVVEIVEDNEKILYLTSSGRRKLQNLRERKKRSFPSGKYQVVPMDRFIIVTFDIPERERRKREWLRSVLKYLGFLMIQKSVWIGKSKITKKLLLDFRQIKLSRYVEIFEITKVGSLREIIDNQ